jgi:hypothetical protein
MSEVQLALPRRDLADVRTQHRSGASGPKSRSTRSGATRTPARRTLARTPARRTLARGRARRDCRETVSGHQPLDPLASDPNAIREPQLGVDSRPAP